MHRERTTATTIQEILLTQRNNARLSTIGHQLGPCTYNDFNLKKQIYQDKILKKQVKLGFIVKKPMLFRKTQVGRV
jgi:hypothetical protein